MKPLGEMGPDDLPEGMELLFSGDGVRLFVPSQTTREPGPLERAYYQRERARARVTNMRRLAELLTGEVVAVYGDDDDGRIDLHYADGRIVHLRSTGYDDTGIDVDLRKTP
jgi:hypothetical protein